MQRFLKGASGRPLMLGLSSGVVGILAYRLPYGWPLAFVALIPLLFASQISSKHHSVRNSLRTLAKIGLAGAIAGILLDGAGSWWMLDSLPLPEAYGVPHVYEGYIFVFSSWLIVIASVGIWMGLWSAVVAWMRLDKAWKWIVAGVVFLASEFAGLIFFNMVTFAPGVSNPLFYSPGFIGYPLADNLSFLQAASFGGIWALSAIVVAVNLLVFYFLRQPKTVRARGLIGLTLVVVVIACLPIASWRAQSDTTHTIPVKVGYMSVGVSVHGISSAAFRSQTNSLALQAVQQVQNNGAPIVLLPEDLIVFAPEGPVTAQSVEKPGVTIIHSGVYDAATGGAALAGYQSDASGDTWLRNKMALVPQGEYVPSNFGAILTLFGEQGAAKVFSDQHALTTGEIGNPAVIGPVRASILFCSELLTPNLGRTIVMTQHSNLLLIASSDALFYGGALRTDTLRFARIQTVEAGVPSVSSVINDPGYALDKFGRTTSYINATPGTVATNIATVEIAKQ